MQYLTNHFRLLSGSFAILMVLSSAGADEGTRKEHPLQPAIRYVKSCVAKVEKLPGYTATFYKNEVVGTSTVSHQMKLKLRHKPFSVYLNFEKPHTGREVIYVEGKNNGNLIAHEAGLLSIAGSMELAPTDKMAMSENRYPITMSGIVKIVNAVIKQWEHDAKYQGTEVKYFKDARLGTLNCRVIESIHPKAYRQFKNHKVQVWVDSATSYPVRVRTYGFPKKAGGKPPVIEDYMFLNLNTDVRLTDADFDQNNEKYNF